MAQKVGAGGVIALRLTVVIPVYNDNEALEACLQALRTQTLPTDEYEIFVVDNGLTESPVVEPGSNVRLLF